MLTIDEKCELYNTPHETVCMKAPFSDEIVHIDKGLENLIEALWDRGLQTDFSCDGYDIYVDQNVWSNQTYRAYIVFRVNEITLSFIQNIIGNYSVFKNNRRRSWDFEFDQYPNSSAPLKGSRVCIRFPKNEIPKLTEFVRNL